jgi:hypothetical protein
VQTLNGLKSGKDRARNLSLVCALMLGASAPESGFPPRAEPPPADRSISAWAVFGSLVFDRLTPTYSSVPNDGHCCGL